MDVTKIRQLLGGSGHLSRAITDHTGVEIGRSAVAGWREYIPRRWRLTLLVLLQQREKDTQEAIAELQRQIDSNKRKS